MRYLKATMIGGALFLVPSVLVVVILGKAMALAIGLLMPLYAHLPHTAFGIGAASLGAIVTLVLVALGAGLFALTATGKRFGSRLENSILGSIPQYQIAKSMADGLARVESSNSIQPALIHVADGWQLGYILEPLEDGWFNVFLPAVPTPMSGTAMLMPGHRVRPVEMTMAQAMGIVKSMGIGSAELLRGVDLTLPARP